MGRKERWDWRRVSRVVKVGWLSEPRWKRRADSDTKNRPVSRFAGEDITSWKQFRRRRASAGDNWRRISPKIVSRLFTHRVVREECCPHISCKESSSSRVPLSMIAASSLRGTRRGSTPSQSRISLVFLERPDLAPETQYLHMILKGKAKLFRCGTGNLVYDVSQRPHRCIESCSCEVVALRHDRSPLSHGRTNRKTGDRRNVP